MSDRTVTRRPFDDPVFAAEAARKGARERKAARGEMPPFAGTVLDAMDAAGLTDASWNRWRTFLRALFGLPFIEGDLETFQRFTGRTTAPTAAYREAYVICGRRSGKTRIAALVAVYLGVRRNYREVLGAGEIAVIPVLGADKRQSQQALNYMRGLFQTPTFAPYLERSLRETIELRTGLVIESKAASVRTTRGFTSPAILADELGFWQASDESSEPDREVIQALLPGMTTIPDAVLLGLSTPYAKTGALYEAHERYYGDDTADVLVWRAPSLEMHPTLDKKIIDRAMEQDPIAASAEYNAEFRSDVSTFIDIDALRAVVNTGRPLELPPRTGTKYIAACDPSGGKADAFTVAIAHADGDRAVLDLVRARKAPFNPTAVVAEFATLLKDYGLHEVKGDHYSAEWVAGAFQQCGVTYRALEKPKSDLYLAILGPLNSERIELPDHKEMLAQFAGLERRTSRSGRDSVDYRVGGHDDLCNAASAALSLVAAGASSGGAVWIQFVKEQVIGDANAGNVARGTVVEDHTPRSKPLPTDARPWRLPEACPTCGARGRFTPSNGGWVTCGNCGGTTFPTHDA